MQCFTCLVISKFFKTSNFAGGLSLFMAGSSLMMSPFGWVPSSFPEKRLKRSLISYICSSKSFSLEMMKPDDSHPMQSKKSKKMVLDISACRIVVLAQVLGSKTTKLPSWAGDRPSVTWDPQTHLHSLGVGAIEIVAHNFHLKNSKTGPRDFGRGLWFFEGFVYSWTKKKKVLGQSENPESCNVEPGNPDVSGRILPTAANATRNATDFCCPIPPKSGRDSQPKYWLLPFRYKADPFWWKLWSTRNHWILAFFVFDGPRPYNILAILVVSPQPILSCQLHIYIITVWGIKPYST